MAYYPGYSSSEYVSEVESILAERYGLSNDEAHRFAHLSDDVRHYGGSYAGMGRGSQARSPSAAASAIGKQFRLRKVPKRGPPMENGYAQKYAGRGDWEIVVVGDDVTSKAVFQGFTRIDGTPHALWRSGRRLYAQIAVGPRHPSHWGGA